MNTIEKSQKFRNQIFLKITFFFSYSVLLVIANQSKLGFRFMFFLLTEAGAQLFDEKKIFLFLKHLSSIILATLIHHIVRYTS